MTRFALYRCFCLFLFAATLCGGAAAAQNLSFTTLPNAPNDSDIGGLWGKAADGIDYDGAHLFYSNATTLYQVKSAAFNHYNKKLDIADLKSKFGTACNHFGGISSSSGEVFVAVEKCDDKRARVAVFDADLNYIRSATLQDENGKDFSGCPGIAFNPFNPNAFYCEKPYDNGIRYGSCGVPPTHTIANCLAMLRWSPATWPTKCQFFQETLPIAQQ